MPSADHHDTSATTSSVLFVDDGSGELADLVPELQAKLRDRELFVASSAAEGLVQLELRQVDAVVSGLRLADGDGAQFLAEVQQRDSGVARLMLCGEASQAELAAAAQVAQQLLSKPCDAATMAVAIERVMAVRRKLSDPKLRQLIGSIDRLPTVPDVYQRIVAAVAEPDYSVKDVAKIISGDVASSVELLKFANSAMFALPRAVVSVEEAVNLLGIRSVSALVLAGSLFQAGSMPEGLDAERMQTIAVAASAVARAVALSDGWPAHDADQVALAAMLRDVGMLVLAQGSPESLAELDGSITDPEDQAHQQQQAFGCTVPAASAYLLGLWNFPQTVVHSVGAQPVALEERGSTPTEQILAYAYHRVLAGPEVRPPTPMLDPYRGLRWSTAAVGVLEDQSEAELSTRP